MSREWEPGDVAIIRIPKASAPGFAVHEHGYVDVPAVHNSVGGWNALSDPDYFWDSGYSFHDAEPRPLVVIDPEDREQVERLGKAIFDNGFTAAGRLADALLEFASPTPPRPDEPTGLGAVVEDSQGKRYVRCDTDRSRWHCPDDDTGASDDFYENIAAVRVLSEGVTP